MSIVAITCAHCGRPATKLVRDVNRANKAGLRLYCDRKCAGLGRRGPARSAVEKKAAKADYDREYRAKNGEMLRAKKAAYFQRTYDPAKARVERAKHAKRHLAYCRVYYADPARKQAKVAYDQQRRYAITYGEFSEAAKLLFRLEQEIRSRGTKYERAAARGVYQRAVQQRKRNEGVSRW